MADIKQGGRPKGAGYQPSKQMKLHTALGTGLIIAGGAVAGLYGAGCVNHYLKLDAALDETYSYMYKELDESKLKSNVEFNMLNLRTIVESCRQYLSSGEVVTEQVQKRCNYFEESLRQLEEQYQLHGQVEGHNRKKSDEAEKEYVHHTNEFWTHAGITALALLLAGVGYKVRKD